MVHVHRRPPSDKRANASAQNAEVGDELPYLRVIDECNTLLAFIGDGGGGVAEFGGGLMRWRRRKWEMAGDGGSLTCR